MNEPTTAALGFVASAVPSDTGDRRFVFLGQKPQTAAVGQTPRLANSNHNSGEIPQQQNFVGKFSNYNGKIPQNFSENFSNGISSQNRNRNFSGNNENDSHNPNGNPINSDKSPLNNSQNSETSAVLQLTGIPKVWEIMPTMDATSFAGGAKAPKYFLGKWDG